MKMPSPFALAWSGFAVYYCVAYLTGAYYFQHRCDFAKSAACELEGGFVGVTWPLYWSGRAALWVTK